jgi:Metallo-beta-lactamase superfamily
VAVAITLEVLPAAYGDAIWIECARAEHPWRMIVDGGPPEATSALAAKVEALDEPIIDVVVVSHIDSDHIGGMLSLLERDDITVGDVWFNGLPQLPEEGEALQRSVAEGEDLIKLLSGITRAEPLPWNRVVDGKALATASDRTTRDIPIDNGPRITLLSPTPKRLVALRREWQQALERLQRGEPEEVEPPTPPEPLTDLQALAEAETANDTSVPNGSSIAFLLEHRGASCLLGADALPTVPGGVLWALANARGGKPVAVDAVKLPHRGSQKNVSAKLLKLVSSKNYVVSTNGEHFGHPDDVALARAVVAGGRGTAVVNYAPTAETQRWTDADLHDRYGFKTRFADGDSGALLELAARS